MILTVAPDKERDLTYVGVAAAALCGTGIGQPFPSDSSGQVIVARPALGPQGVTVQCVQALAGLAKNAYVALGYQIISPVSPTPQPPKNFSVTLTVTAKLPDAAYPLGIGAEGWGGKAATALYGAGFLRDAYGGGADSSFQVACDKNDLAAVIGGFACVFFTATPAI